MKDLTHIATNKRFQDSSYQFSKKYFIAKKRKLVACHHVGTQKEFNSCWSELKSDFKELQSDRCAICEMKITDITSATIEHYRDKGYYWWLAYNPNNYYLACRNCNSHLKRTHFPLDDESKKVGYESRKGISEEVPLLINPLLENPEKYFDLVFKTDSNSGKNVLTLIPSKTLDKTSLEYKKAERTAEIYDFALSNENVKKNYHAWRVNAELCDKLLDFARLVERVSLDSNRQKELIDFLKKEKDKNFPITEFSYTKVILSVFKTKVKRFEIKTVP
jgi:uncharacterized protein (TIGR02646 family)